MHLNTGKNYNNKLKEYIAAYNDLDEERKGLDFEMEDLLKEIDTEKRKARELIDSHNEAMATLKHNNQK